MPSDFSSVSVCQVCQLPWIFTDDTGQRRVCQDPCVTPSPLKGGEGSVTHWGPLTTRLGAPKPLTH